jgi:hypothetical protein
LVKEGGRSEGTGRRDGARVAGNKNRIDDRGMNEKLLRKTNHFDFESGSKKMEAQTFLFIRETKKFSDSSFHGT